MTDIHRAREQVERWLADLWEVDEVFADSDGDYPYRSGSAACYISVIPGHPTAVRATALAATGVKRTARLLTELNDITLHSRTAHVSWSRGAVVVRRTDLYPGMDQRILEYSGRTVAGIANDIGALVATVYGGQVPFPDGRREVS